DLIQEPAQNRDAFPEITRTERALLLGAAALQIDAPHRRRAVLTRALVELTRLDRETLRECRRIMRVCRDNLEPRDCGSAERRAAPRPRRRWPLPRQRRPRATRDSVGGPGLST